MLKNYLENNNYIKNESFEIDRSLLNCAYFESIYKPFSYSTVNNEMYNKTLEFLTIMKKNNTWTHTVHTDEQLKEIVRNVYDCKTFTSLQCKGNESSVFMIMMFIGNPPLAPDDSDNIRKNRKNKLEYMNNCQIYEEETEIREDYIKNIGMLYEDYSKAGPLSVNGYPTFFSCSILSIDDTKRFIDLYIRYEKLRVEFDNNF